MSTGQPQLVTLAQFQAMPGSPSMATLRRRLAKGELRQAMVHGSRPGRGHPALFDLQSLRGALKLAPPATATPAAPAARPGEALGAQLQDLAREVAALKREVAEATSRFDGAMRQLALRYDTENALLRNQLAAVRQASAAASDPLQSARLAQIQSSLRTLIDLLPTEMRRN